MTRKLLISACILVVLGCLGFALMVMNSGITIQDPAQPVTSAGIDVREIVNLVFAKPVYSYTKFWQMVGRGTRIELLLKKDEKEYLETHRLKNIILKHSKFVPFPIFLDGEMPADKFAPPAPVPVVAAAMPAAPIFRPVH